MEYKTHILKIQPQYFRDILYYHKTFELRKDDRDYKVGDCIHFINVDGEEFELYKSNLYRIMYILRNVEEYGLNKEYCILAIRKVTEFDL